MCGYPEKPSKNILQKFLRLNKCLSLIYAKSQNKVIFYPNILFRRGLLGCCEVRQTPHHGRKQISLNMDGVVTCAMFVAVVEQCTLG